MDLRKPPPLISIGIPTFNGAGRIRKALNSILAQDYPNLELIIGDNCSTDNTCAVTQQVIKEHPETTIRYFRHPENLGILKNFQFTLQQATGKYFMWVADDDILEKGVLLRYAQFLEDHPEYVNISGKIKYWKEDKMLFDEQFTLEQDNPSARVAAFYARVRWTGMSHGIMRTEVVQRIPLRQVFGSDYHFVATAAYLGKMKSFDFVGYHKWLGGVSEYRKPFAKSLGESAWAANFPRIKIAVDALREPYRSPVYSGLSSWQKLSLGVASGCAVLYNYGIKMNAEAVVNQLRKLLSVARQRVHAHRTGPKPLNISKPKRYQI